LDGTPQTLIAQTNASSINDEAVRLPSAQLLVDYGIPGLAMVKSRLYVTDKFCILLCLANQSAHVAGLKKYMAQ
jgi:hypothetical protein